MKTLREFINLIAESEQTISLNDLGSLFNKKGLPAEIKFSGNFKQKFIASLVGGDEPLPKNLIKYKGAKILVNLEGYTSLIFDKIKSEDEAYQFIYENIEEGWSNLGHVDKNYEKVKSLKSQSNNLPQEVIDIIIKKMDPIDFLNNYCEYNPEKLVIDTNEPFTVIFDDGTTYLVK